MSLGRFMDPLAGDSDSESPSGSDSDSGSGQEAKRRKPAAAEKAPPPPVDLESLTHGSSVLFVPEPKPTGEQAWDWGSGTDHKNAGGDTETEETRQTTREAVGSGLEHSVEQSFKTAQRTAELREAKRKEHHDKQEERRKSYQQKEKRKRDMGMQKSGKNFVEEEKRLQRSFGVYSGFDN